MKVIEIVENINYSSMVGNPQNEVTGITSNSKEVQKGYMFCAIKGNNFDGHIFIDSAIQKGVSAILLEDIPFEIPESVTYVKVKSTREYTPL